MEGVRKKRREKVEKRERWRGQRKKKVAEEAGEKENCETRALPKLHIFLTQRSTVAPPVHIYPLSDYPPGLLSFTSPGDCSTEWGHQTSRSRLKHVSKKKTCSEKELLISAEMKKCSTKEVALGEPSKISRLC